MSVAFFCAVYLFPVSVVSASALLISPIVGIQLIGVVVAVSLVGGVVGVVLVGVVVALGLGVSLGGYAVGSAHGMISFLLGVRS